MLLTGEFLVANFRPGCLSLCRLSASIKAQGKMTNLTGRPAAKVIPFCSQSFWTAGLIAVQWMGDILKNLAIIR